MARKNSSRYTTYKQKDELEDVNAFLRSENHFMKTKNEELAKALADLKIEHQNTLKNSFQLHERLFTVDVEKSRYKEFIRSMSSEIEQYVQQFITFTELMTNSLAKVNTVIKDPDTISQFVNTAPMLPSTPSAESHRTAAVMPMISGHTISNPKISLPRVTVKQLTDMVHTNNRHDINPNRMDTNEIGFPSFSENASATSDEHFDMSSPSSEQINPRLETMQEEDEEDVDEDEEESQTINSPPVLSGVFRDVKVYISPLNSQHFLQFKSKGASRKTSKSASNISKRKRNNLSLQDSCPSHSLSQEPEQSSDRSGHISSTSSQNQSWIKKSNDDTNSTVKIGDDDPLEGPSSLLNNTRDVIPTPNTVPKQTSTPYMSSNTSKKSKTSTEVKTPKRSGSPNTPTTSKTSAKVKTPKRSRAKSVQKRLTNNVTTRRKRTVSSNMSNCSVKLQSISPSQLKSLKRDSSTTAKKSSKRSRERVDSPRILERSRNADLSASYLVSTPPSPKRGKRNKKIVIYTEPSLIRKLRRSK